MNHPRDITEAQARDAGYVQDPQPWTSVLPELAGMILAVLMIVAVLTVR